MIKTKRGLELPIAGAPQQAIEDARPARSVAILGLDSPGLKPTMEVKEGDRVVKGQLVFTDKKSPGIKYTAPASGTVSAIHRAEKRAFMSLAIEVDGDDELTFDVAEPAQMSREQVVACLIDSGEWTSLRNRPFSRVPAPSEIPNHIFVTAIDTRPLAADPQLFIDENKDAFRVGLDVVASLTAGKVFVCAAPETNIPSSENPQVQVETFSGPHPAGLVGTHIHFLAPVSQTKSVWHIGYQNLIAIGHLFTTGKIFSERVVSLAGPSVEKPRLLRTRIGASLDELTAGEIVAKSARTISGSVFDGRKSAGSTAYLGRFHNQVSVLEEGTTREFFGFVMPGTTKFSLTRIFLSSIVGKKIREITTSTGGSSRAMVPLGTYEDVMPLDILPTQLLRALLVSDIDTAIQLGCLELDEEDLSLCTFACPGKYEYGPYLREMLTRIEAEG
jgi:Na+-transporting NADH:ubiquinone oxidoreductase subunit A